jgi:aminoglycoside/choline kinase family phosphotransferase
VTRAHFANAWAEPLAEVVAAPTTWALRDYHSPNLLWLPRRSGLARIGLLDFQDAVLGHPAYDLVSLLQDARQTVPPALELKLLGAYARAHRLADASFDLDAFARAYAILGAQPNSRSSASRPPRPARPQAAVPGAFGSNVSCAQPALRCCRR